MLAMDWFGNNTLHETPFTNITIRGQPVAAVQNVESFSFAYVVGALISFRDFIDATNCSVLRRVYQSGHEVVSIESRITDLLLIQCLLSPLSNPRLPSRSSRRFSEGSSCIRYHEDTV